MATISVSFENRDMADIAMSRLRRKGIAYKVSEEQRDENSPGAPFSPEFYANILFPGQIMNVMSTGIASPVPNIGSRAVMSAATLGIPAYSGGGEVHIRFMVNDAYRDTARSILRNSGGYDIK